MTQSPHLTVRLCSDHRALIEARTKLTGRSLNAEVIAMLSVHFENDPLTQVRIVEDKGRFFTASAFTGERFRSYSRKSLAEIAAKEALAIVTGGEHVGEAA